MTAYGRMKAVIHHTPEEREGLLIFLGRNQHRLRERS